MGEKIPWDLIVTVIVAIIGSSWFSNLVQNRSKYSNKAILAEVKAVREEGKANAADVSRRRVLDFDDEIRKGDKHTKENWNDVLADIDKYEDYCRHHPEYHNTRAVMAEEHIKEDYQRAVDANDFL